MAFAQPYAEVIETPENPNKDPEIALAIQLLNDIKVPDSEDVDIPAYPGARIFQTSKSQVGMLPTVRLLTPDNVATVIKFYRKALPDWQSKETYGITMFYKTDESKAMMGQEAVVQIEDAEKFNKVSPTARSAITIGYDRKK